MAEKVNWQLAMQDSIEFAHVLDSHGFGIVEQLVVVDALREAMAKALAFYAIFGHEANELVEKLMKAEAVEAVEEAEDILKEEM